VSGVTNNTVRVGALAATLALLWTSASAQVLSLSAQRGLTIARTNCARCHSIDKVSESPLKIAPPFRTLHERYPVTDLQEPLAEGIVTGHPTMPEFRFDPDQVRDLVTYLKTCSNCATPQCDIKVGVVMEASTVRVVPPNTCSRRRECP
jgi:mono/diheme cytochrome c family protein